MTPENQNVPVCGLAVAKFSARGDRLAKLAEALGWIRCDRLGKEVWYDPEGGHVSWEELPAAIESGITELIAECKDKPLRADDAAALEKLGNPFSQTARLIAAGDGMALALRQVERAGSMCLSFKAIFAAWHEAKSSSPNL